MERLDLYVFYISKSEELINRQNAYTNNDKISSSFREKEYFRVMTLTDFQKKLIGLI